MSPAHDVPGVGHGFSLLVVADDEDLGFHGELSAVEIVRAVL